MQKILEYADYIELSNGEVLNYLDKDAYPFLFYNNKFLIGNEGGDHYEIIEKYLKNNYSKYYYFHYKNDDIGEIIMDKVSDECDHTGRIWLKHNIIAFWSLKSNEHDTLKLIINKLNKKFNINIDYDKWKIEYYDPYDDKLYMIKLSDYFNNIKGDAIGNAHTYISKKDVELRKKWHQMTPNEKEKYKIKPSYYKSKPLAWKQALLTSESNTPNELFYNNDKLNWYDSDARSFGFINNKGYISDYKSTHINLPFKYGFNDFKNIIGDGKILKLNDAKKIRNGMDYSGRIWDDRKIISFWNYPESKEKLLKLLDILKKEDNSINFKDFLVSLPYNEFVKINDYEYNDFKQNIDIEHSRSPLDKKNKEVPSGLGSKKYKPIELKYKLYQETHNNMNKVYERINTKMNIPKDVKRMHNIFKKNGYKLFVVGGAVRDYLLGKIPHDFDLVTNALPDDIIRMLKGYRTDITGAKFGVVRVYTEDEPSGYEIATYRKDISKGRDNKGNDKKVEIGRHLTVKDDVKRRDLTINALFYDLDNHQIVDVVGGIRDLNRGIVRAVGEPQKRFNEDRLRILRTIRFAAVTGSKIDERTSNAIKKDNRLFGISDEDDVSRERIFKEFIDVKEKSRINDDPLIMTRFIDLLVDYGILKQIFPVLVINKNIKPTKYLSVALAQTLIKNNPNNRFKQTLIDAKIHGKYVDIISFLIKIFKYGVDEDDVYDLYREMISKGIRIDILEEWIKVMNINDKKVIGLLKYKPTINAKDVINDGFKGADIGREIRKRESENFIKLIENIK